MPEEKEEEKEEKEEENYRKVINKKDNFRPESFPLVVWRWGHVGQGFRRQTTEQTSENDNSHGDLDDDDDSDDDDDDYDDDGADDDDADDDDGCKCKLSFHCWRQLSSLYNFPKTLLCPGILVTILMMKVMI